MTEFVTIPAGWFHMGSDAGQDDERPVHRVWVDSFDLAVYPVTRAQYGVFLNATGHEPPREWTNPQLAGDLLPVVGVSWNDAVAYCSWYRTSSAEALGREEHGDVRLPTEAEWEHAARGGVEFENFPWGQTMPAWVPQEGRGPLKAPWPVTLGPANAFGVVGIAGNIHEWCSDWHARDYYEQSPERNPTGPEAGVRRASRGGSWRHAFTMSRSAARSKLDPSFRYTDYGFRIARSL